MCAEAGVKLVFAPVFAWLELLEELFSELKAIIRWHRQATYINGFNHLTAPQLP
jgi:hypothetical protein